MLWLIQSAAGGTPTSVQVGEVGFVETGKPEEASRIRRKQEDAADDWLCAHCHNRVASERDRLELGGISEFWFTNPVGFRFNILTFSKASGGRELGEPTLDHTWFSGHAWSYCICSQCGSHLGWFYTGPSRFAGLIRERIVLAAAVMN